MKEYSSYLLSKEGGSLREIIENAIKKYWSNPAYSDFGTEIEYSFGEVARQIACLHDYYRANGIMPGDKVALCSKNCSNWSVSMLSFLTYGCVGVPILADFHADQVANIVEHSDSKLLICSTNWYNTLQGTVKVPMIDINNLPTNSDKYNNITPADVNYGKEDPEAIALINYTSGSTGNSKGVMLAYRVLWSNTIFADERLRMGENGRLVSLLPAAHMYGYAFEFLYEFCIGCHDYFLSKAPSPSYLMQVFAAVKPTIIVSVPLIIEKVVTGTIFPKLRTPEMQAKLAIPGVKEVVYKQVRDQLVGAFGGEFIEAIIGGASFSKEVEDFLVAIKFPFTVGYGMTECGPIICYQHWDKFAPSSCGVPAPRMEVEIDSKDPEHIPGEIITRGINVMSGYYKNPEATAEAIDKDGWLHTGDLATMDAEGNVFIRGRKKSMYLGANGQNIYPEEVEDTINSYSIFDENVVAQRGEKLVAMVYVSDDTLQKAGKTREEVMNSLDEIRNEINTHLPKFANITTLEVRDTEFEKTPKRNIKRYLYL